MEKIITKIECCGPNFSIELFWERLILHSLTKKRAENIFQAFGVLLVIEPVDALWLQQHSISPFFGTPCTLKSLKCSSLSRDTVNKGWNGFVVDSYFFRMGCRHGKPELRDDDVTYLAKSRYNVLHIRVSVKSRFSSMYFIFLNSRSTFNLIR